MQSLLVKGLVMALPLVRRSQRIAALESVNDKIQLLQQCHLSTGHPATCQAAAVPRPAVGPKRRRARGIATKQKDSGGDGGAERTSGEGGGREVVESKKQGSPRVYPTRDGEMRVQALLWQMGYRHVAGVDEAGRGPLAGPVVAAACVIPRDTFIPGIDDSKKLKEKERERLYEVITTTPGVIFATCVVSAETVDRINILQAAMEAMGLCVQQLCRGEGEGVTEGDATLPDYILIDGNRLPGNLPDVKAEGVVRGDSEHYVVAAASVLAKVTRDRLMAEYDKVWPEYGFKHHKGYGTEKHIAALLTHGPCDIHRRSFAPLKDWNSKKGAS